MHKKAYLKHLENIGIEDPETSKALDFMTKIYNHDANQFNKNFGKKLTSHTRADTSLSNSHLTKEIEDLEKNAGLSDMISSLAAGVGKLKGRMDKKDVQPPSGGYKTLREPIKAIEPVKKRITPIDPHVAITSKESAINKNAAETGGLSKLVGAVGKMRGAFNRVKNDAKGAYQESYMRAVNPNINKMIRPKSQQSKSSDIPVPSDKSTITNDVMKTPPQGSNAVGKNDLPAEAFRTDQRQKVSQKNEGKKPEPKRSESLNVKDTNQMQGVPYMTDRNTAMTPTPKMTRPTVSPQQSNQAPHDPSFRNYQGNTGYMNGLAPAPNASMITPNATLVDQAAIQKNSMPPTTAQPAVPQQAPIQVPGKQFGAIPFDPNGTMANRAIIPNTPRGEVTPQPNPRFGAVPFNPMDQQGPAQGVVQPNTQEMNAINSAIRPHNPQLSPAQGAIQPNTQEMNAINSAIGPQKQNAVNPNASAIEQAAQAQQQPKIVNNTMKPAPEPKQEAASGQQPKADSKESQAISKQKEQLGALKQKAVFEKLHQRLKSLEQAAKQKPSEEKSKSDSADTRKVEAIKPESDTKDTTKNEAVDKDKTQAMTPENSKIEGKVKSNVPMAENSDQASSSEDKKTQKLKMFDQASNMKNDSNLAKKRKQERENSDEAKLQRVKNEIKAENQRFEKARNEALANRDAAEKAKSQASEAKTTAIEPEKAKEMSKSDAENRKAKDAEAANSQKSERPTADSGESLGRAQSGSGRDANYAIGYKGPESPKKSIRERVADSIRGGVNKIRGKSENSDPKSVQRMSAVSSKPENVFATRNGQDKSPESSQAQSAPQQKKSDNKTMGPARKIGPRPIEASSATEAQKKPVEPSKKSGADVNTKSQKGDGSKFSPITGNDHPNSQSGQNKIREHIMSAMGKTKEEASKKWNSMTPDQQKGAMIGATLLASAAVVKGLSSRSKRKKEEERHARRAEMADMINASRNSGGYNSYGRY